MNRRMWHLWALCSLSAAFVGCGQSSSVSSSSGGSKRSSPAASARTYSVPNARKLAAGDEPTYVILTNGNSPFWAAARVGMDQAGKDLNVKVVMEVNDGTDQGQIEKLRQIATRSNVVGLAISVNKARTPGIVDEMRKLQQLGVHIVTADSDVDRQLFRDARYGFIGTDNLIGGRELGACARGLKSEGGKFVTFVGHKDAQNAIERVRGFAEGAGESFKAIDNMGDGTDRTRARDNVRNAIQNHPNLNTLVGIWSYNAPAIVDVVKELNKRAQYTIVVFDAEPLAITQMSEGMIDAMVVQNPYEMGYQGIRTLKALVQADESTTRELFPSHGQPDGDLYDTGLKVVAPDEHSPLKADLFGPKTQFMKLSDFRAWLDKYSLTGS